MEFYANQMKQKTKINRQAAELCFINIKSVLRYRNEMSAYFYAGQAIYVQEI